jgi:anti-sigma factor RsiW
VPDSFSDQDLAAFLDEALPIEEATRLEQALRDDEALRRRLGELAAATDRGEHSLGAVWRRRRLTCFDRSTLGSYVLGVLPEDERRYLEFHVNVIGCRICAANLDELREQAASQPPQTTGRRKRIFDSSIGRLRKE